MDSNHVLDVQTQLGYSRAVDFLPPSCVMIPRDLYMESMIGLDNSNSCLLSHSVQLSLAVAARNHSIIYQPAAVVSLRLDTRSRAQNTQ
jgi:hypothetical protein